MTQTGLTDITADLLVRGHIIYLDGRPREVLDVTESDVSGYRHLTVEGFSAPLHVGGHWEYPLVTS